MRNSENKKEQSLLEDNVLRAARAYVTARLRYEAMSGVAEKQRMERAETSFLEHVQLLLKFEGSLP